MKELSQIECIDIRKTLLFEFHKMCEKNGLRYSIAYGTLLGAVRHGGMIPWDDDIDVVVPREDFERLCAIYKQSDCKDRYQFISHRNHPEIKTKIGYFIDFNTITETANKSWEYHGVHIDIYPMDIIPNKPSSKRQLLRRRWFLHKIIRAKDIHPEVMHGFSKFIRLVVLGLCAPFNYDKTLDKLHKVSMKYKDMPENERKEVCILVESGDPLCFPYAVTTEYATYDYDGHQYQGYKDYDSMLKIWYGDYMTPPAEKDRKMPEHKFVHFYLKDEEK